MCAPARPSYTGCLLESYCCVRMARSERWSVVAIIECVQLRRFSGGFRHAPVFANAFGVYTTVPSGALFSLPRFRRPSSPSRRVRKHAVAANRSSSRCPSSPKTGGVTHATLATTALAAPLLFLPRARVSLLLLCFFHLFLGATSTPPRHSGRPRGNRRPGYIIQTDSRPNPSIKSSAPEPRTVHRGEPTHTRPQFAFVRHAYVLRFIRGAE